MKNLESFDSLFNRSIDACFLVQDILQNDNNIHVHVSVGRRQKFSEGGSFDMAGGLGAAQGFQKPLGIWCKILQSSNFQTLHSNFRKANF